MLKLGKFVIVCCFAVVIFICARDVACDADYGDGDNRTEDVRFSFVESDKENNIIPSGETATGTAVFGADGIGIAKNVHARGNVTQVETEKEEIDYSEENEDDEESMEDDEDMDMEMMIMGEDENRFRAKRYLNLATGFNTETASPGTMQSLLASCQLNNLLLYQSLNQNQGQGLPNPNQFGFAPGSFPTPQANFPNGVLGSLYPAAAATQEVYTVPARTVQTSYITTSSFVTTLTATDVGGGITKTRIYAVSTSKVQTLYFAKTETPVLPSHYPDPNATPPSISILNSSPENNQNQQPARQQKQHRSRDVESSATLKRNIASDSLSRQIKSKSRFTTTSGPSRKPRQETKPSRFSRGRSTTAGSVDYYDDDEDNTNYYNNRRPKRGEQTLEELEDTVEELDYALQPSTTDSGVDELYGGQFRYGAAVPPVNKCPELKINNPNTVTVTKTETLVTTVTKYLNPTTLSSSTRHLYGSGRTRGYIQAKVVSALPPTTQKPTRGNFARRQWSRFPSGPG